MKNIHILPTDKPSNLVFEKLSNRFYTNSRRKSNTNNLQNQNIYITSDDEIKEGDWVLFMFDEVTEIVKVTTIVNNAFDSKKGFGYGLEYCKKIILTTDQDLIKDGVQAIDDKFLEWFVKNTSCEEVKVEYGCCGQCDERLCEVFDLGLKQGLYKINIPEEIQPQQIWNEEKMEGVKKLIQKQKLIDMMEQDEQLGLYQETKCYCGHTTYCDCGPEEPKQETLEEAAANYSKELAKDCEDEWINREVAILQKRDFESGAKWQEERSYSEEEVKNIVDETIEKFYKHFYTLTKAEMKEQWFEQFKKK